MKSAISLRILVPFTGDILIDKVLGTGCVYCCGVSLVPDPPVGRPRIGMYRTTYAIQHPSPDTLLIHLGSRSPMKHLPLRDTNFNPSYLMVFVLNDIRGNG